MFTIKGKYTSALITIDGVDETTLAQLYVMASHPSCTNPIAVMPDCHAGKGCCIGFTMKASDKVVPNFVGVDIGCGMLSAQTPLKAEDFSEAKLAAIDTEIRKIVPMGMTVNDRVHHDVPKQFADLICEIARKNDNEFTNSFKFIGPEQIQALIRHYEVESGYFYASLGSLGGGNHFIEAGISSLDGTVWFTVHTGSRNFGKKVCEHFDDLAKSNFMPNKGVSEIAGQLKEDVANGLVNKKDIARILAERKQRFKVDFDVKMSAYLSGQDLTDYMQAMFLAQVYAQFNRELIVEKIFDVLGSQFNTKVRIGDSIETVHNFISFRDGVIRKGAVESYVGQRLVIPFNMRDGILICEGKSNTEWNNSAPHGAGRLMSRSQAKEKVTMEEFKKSMEGIFSTSVCPGTRDESPMAYKDAAMIEAAIAPTAEILFRIKPIYSVKAGGE